MTYITNSTGTFNLDSDKIIYLTNLGVPDSIIQAMMQRDQALQQQFAAAQAAQQAQEAQPGPPPASSQTAPAPGAEATNVPDLEPPQPVTVNYFYDTLAPYGSWVAIGGYGNCWRPTVCYYNPAWQPYCDHGRWVYTSCGWYWASSYGWGCTFHYGRWFRSPTYGWCWYPDTVWAPSWVTWRYSNNYCGWAPLPPHTTYQAGVGIAYNGRGISVGFGFGLGANCFTFVPTQYFCSPHPRTYCVAPAQVTQVYNNTTVVNNYNVNNRLIVNHGIPAQTIATASRTTIHPIPIRQARALDPRPWSGQSYNSPGSAYGVQHPVYNRDINSPLRTPRSSPYVAPQSQRNIVAAAAPQNPPPLPNNRVQPAGGQVQNREQRADYSNPQKSYSESEPYWTPRNQTRYNESHYNESRYNNSPAQQHAPQQGSSGRAYSPPQGGQQGGGRGGNQGWPGH